MYLAIILLSAIVIIGTVGYILIEDYTLIDALYMTIITMSTVGFQEVDPLSNMGRIFTFFLIVTSFGIFAYAVTTLTRYIVDGIFRYYYMDVKISKRIKKLKNHVIVCGYGRNGRQAMEELMRHHVEAVIIDSNQQLIDQIQSLRDILTGKADLPDEARMH